MYSACNAAFDIDRTDQQIGMDERVPILTY